MVLSTLSQRTQFTHVRDLNSDQTEATVIGLFHDHEKIVRLNPLVIEVKRVDMPTWAPEEEAHWEWYEIHDRLPVIGLKVIYHGGFSDKPNGLETHVYAPMGVEIREHWRVGKSNELDPQRTGDITDVVREDVDLNCNMFMAKYVRDQLTDAHNKMMAQIASAHDAQHTVGS